MKFWLAVAFLDTEDLTAVARVAEASGWHGITVSDHLFYPRNLRSSYPYSPDGTPLWQPDTPWPDPWVAIAAMAAVTTHLRFATNVYVAPARDLFTVAKLVSTAAVLSGDRVSLGVGPGWCEEEFEQTGQAFATRGRRLDEMIPVLRELWSGDWTEHRGTHYDFDPVRIGPVPGREIPVLVGGHSRVAMRRAARLGDGWIGVLYTPEDAAARVAELRGHLQEHGRDPAGFEIVLSLLARDDLDLYRRCGELGVTGIVHAPWMLAQPAPGESLLDARLAAIERFGEEFIAPLAPKG